MSYFEVLGGPDPGLPSTYRGTSRAIPFVQDELGLSHPANRHLLDLLDTKRWGHEELGQNDSGQHDPEVAETLAAIFRESGLGPFEVVERTRPGENPRHADRLLGYDVSFEPGYESILAGILLQEGDDTESWLEAEPQARRLRAGYRDRLNDNLLFTTPEDAIAFQSEVNRYGPWEGPDFAWEVVGLWIREGAST